MYFRSEAETRSAFWRAIDWLVIAGIPLGLIAAWLIVYFAWPLSFWTTGDDYVNLSLAHALHFEAKLRGEAVLVDAGLVAHPGVPFYVMSWLCMRAAAFFSSGTDVLVDTFTNPDGFFLATRIATGSITAIAIAGVWCLLRGLTAPWRCVAILSFFATSPMSFHCALTRPCNETFTLPLSVLLFWSIQNLLKSAPEDRRPWFLLGAVAAIGYSVKLLYLDILVAVYAVAIADSIWRCGFNGTHWIRSSVRPVTLITLSFGIVAIAILVAALGPRGVLSLLHFHFQVAFHTGYYGQGDAGPVSIQSVYVALKRISTTPLPYLWLGTVGLNILALRWQYRSGDLDRATILRNAAASAAFLAATAFTLKQYSSHYVLALGAMWPFLLLPVLLQHRLRWIVAAGVGVGLWASIVTQAADFAEYSQRAADIKNDEEKISELPLNPGEARLWTYGIPSQYFAAAFLARDSGVPSILALVSKPTLQELSSFAKIDRPYRYVVVSRARYPDADAIRNTPASLEPTQVMMVRPEPGDKIHALKTVMVVERASR